MTGCCPTCGRRTSAPERWTRERIRAAVYVWVYENGQPPRYEDWRRSDPDGRWPCSQTLIELYGTFAQAIRANGYKPGRSSSVRRKPTRTAA